MYFLAQYTALNKAFFTCRMSFGFTVHGEICFIYSHKKSKSKAIPLQAWTGPEDSRRLRLPDFKTIDTLMW
jgi:hypothetical protein